MKNNKAVTITNIYKSFNLYNKPLDRLKESIHPFRKKYHTTFKALNNINLDIVKEETLGIIGENGAGKSTLLKIIAGVLSPTAGKIKVNGRISTLLELGVGFNPEMTGLENIFVYGTLMKLSSKEIKEKTSAIVDFAEIGQYINQPVKMYSSGMFAKLAFSTAINVNPNILIVDEVLSVGDEYFQQKSFNKISELKKQGTTIIFCSHSMYHIQEICDKVVWLKNGAIEQYGKPLETTDAYISYSRKKSVRKNKSNTKTKTSSAFIEKIEFNKTNFSTGDKISLNISIKNQQNDHSQFMLGVTIKRNDNIDVFGVRSDNFTIEIPKETQKTINFTIENLLLLSGNYYIICYLFDKSGITIINNVISEEFSVGSSSKIYGITKMDYKWKT